MNMVSSPKNFLFLFLGLAGLTLATSGIALINLGGMNFPIAILIACLQASIIIYYYMHIQSAEILVKIFAVGTLLWLSILILLTFNDYFSRYWTTNPSLWP